MIRITALFKAWRMKNIRENMMSEPWKNAVSVWRTDILRMRFKKYGFICSRGLLSPARQTVPAALYAFCSVACGSYSTSYHSSSLLSVLLSSGYELLSSSESSLSAFSCAFDGKSSSD